MVKEDLIAVNLYVDETEKTRKIKKILNRYRLPYLEYKEPTSRCQDKKTPYLTIGDPDRNPLGPVDDLETIKKLVRILTAAGPLVDPRVKK